MPIREGILGIEIIHSMWHGDGYYMIPNVTQETVHGIQSIGEFLEFVGGKSLHECLKIFNSACPL